ncbi:hypothetical protein C2R22_17530 [Salinigranum rubrum]|uniref:Uncharacterized protein n=1 Tax=Salinigranum rubrum TaxID=755307 RepID=A0A2I8VMR4_9EURY|nr:hypothetical protein [Salinigranum rubrum]AUV83220.1 hypothetical protein C2R22_17530 [Salinigranum rubrum]
MIELTRYCTTSLTTDEIECADPFGALVLFGPVVYENDPDGREPAIGLHIVGEDFKSMTTFTVEELEEFIVYLKKAVTDAKTAEPAYFDVESGVLYER